MTSSLDRGKLAFEEFEHASPPADLWRVSGYRFYNDRELAHINWFATEDAAHNHAKWVEDGRGKITGISHYRLVSD